MRVGDKVQLLADYEIERNGFKATHQAGSVGTIRVPLTIGGWATVQINGDIIDCPLRYLRLLDIDRQLTDDDITEVYRLRLADLRAAYLAELRRYAAAAQNLKRQRDEAIERLNAANHQTD